MYTSHIWEYIIKDLSTIITRVVKVTMTILYVIGMVSHEKVA